MHPTSKQTYLITITTRGVSWGNSASDPAQRTAMRNALHRHGGREVLPGLWSVALTPAERAELTRRFGARARRG